MSERKGISKKTRFEVFKRDSFQCQYCGASAPDVVLHIDHIAPVSKGGDNDMLNLITSCESCNSGKSNRELCDDSAITKQRAQLESLNKRREQLEMMLSWREAMKNIDEQQIDAAIREFESACKDSCKLNEKGRDDMRRIVKKHGLAAVLKAIDAAAESYIRFDEDGKCSIDSANKASEKLEGIIRVQSQLDDVRPLFYIRGILRKRLSYCDDSKCLEALKEAKAAGAEVEELTAIAKEARSWTAWRAAMDTLTTDLESAHV